MAGLLQNFRNTIIVSVVLSLILVAGYRVHHGSNDAIFWQGVFRMIHVFAGILWIGLLYYFNFVQIRVMPSVPAELKAGVTKYIAPEALFWFRWAAVATLLAGIVLAWNRGYLVEAYTLGALEGFANPQTVFIGVGMWMATIMFLNVWLFIWPNQKIALGLVEADADAPIDPLAAARPREGRDDVCAGAVHDVRLVDASERAAHVVGGFRPERQRCNGSLEHRETARLAAQAERARIRCERGAYL